MTDMLVRLYDLPPVEPALARLAAAGIVCRRPEAYERSAVLGFVRAHFPGWVDETQVALARTPATCFIAQRGGDVLGFACFHATRPNFFGPTGVAEAERGRGIGAALLLLALHAMAAEGYAYAIIGSVGPAAFYERTVGAVPIPGSHPGIYRNRLDRPAP
ncbi:GNAT family N-acetyltransferase [Tepidiforma bonchosmolovskayae]|jgi:GNAT superfamily N-acetyltransferase|uniref:GNAT family N-acetyltransferase n=2 Tax=Tepidiformaceae TaxID=2682227 RepID=A0ABX6C2Z4_9CHLR|nr:GNAT family N-acetyltransferase [Tepidiforma bonchosmolovskayae]